MSRFIALAAASLMAFAGLLAAQGQTAGGAAGGSPITRAAVVRAKMNAQSTIQGNVLTLTNGPIADAPVRLRDARFGRILDAQVTGRSGMFSFASVDPGSYIVELMSRSQTVLAASPLLSVNGGETVSVVVKLPFRATPGSGLLSTTSASSLTAIGIAAAASGVAAIVPTTPVSPNR